MDFADLIPAHLNYRHRLLSDHYLDRFSMEYVEQNITVETKGQLIAAFECARYFFTITKIKLLRKTGQTEYKVYFNAGSKKEHEKINRLKRNVRKTKAIDLLT